MGEWKIQIPMRLAAVTVGRMDKDVQRFRPFCEGRSAIGRVLIEYAYAAIDAGILRWDLEWIQASLDEARHRAVQKQVLLARPTPALPTSAPGKLSRVVRLRLTDEMHREIWRFMGLDDRESFDETVRHLIRCGLEMKRLQREAGTDGN
jgi:hypothetical protein